MRLPEQYLELVSSKMQTETLYFISVAKLCVETGRFTELHLFSLFLSRKHSAAKWFHLSTEIFYKYRETFICARTVSRQEILIRSLSNYIMILTALCKGLSILTFLAGMR
jgi:hypothetical protein